MRTALFLFTVHCQIKKEISKSDFKSDYSKARAMFDYFDSDLLFKFKWFVSDPLLFKEASSDNIDIFLT